MTGRSYLKILLIVCGLLSLILGVVFCIAAVINRQTANRFLSGVETQAVVMRLNVFDVTRTNWDGSDLQASTSHHIAARYTLRDGREMDSTTDEFVRAEQHEELSVGDRVTIVYMSDIPSRFTLKESAEFYVNEVGPGTLRLGVICIVLGLAVAIAGIVVGKILIPRES